MMPPPAGPPGALPASDIVLLEESDLYRYRDDGSVLQDGAYAPKPSFSAAVPPPDPVKYARSVHSHRSHRSGGHGSHYMRHSTPYAATDKRTASIDTIPAHYGALRPGGPVNLFTRAFIGLLLNWIIVGFFNGVIPGLVTPLFKHYLGFSRAQRNATLPLFDFGWYFKFLFGFLTDCYPIRRQRRKPYIFIGWTIFLGFMLAMTFMDQVEWYGTADDVRNPDAPSQGKRYIIPILISSFAHLTANVACEGLMVEYAHREGEYDRGRTQLWCVIFRFIGEISGSAYAAFGLSSAEYGGTFASSIPLAWYFGSLAIVAFIGIVITYFYLEEEQVAGTRQSFGSNLRRFWRFIEQRVTLQVMVGLFILSLGVNISVHEYYDIYDAWLETSSLAQSVMSVVQSTGYMIAAGMVFLWFINTNWRVMIIGGFSIALVISMPIELLTTWAVVRSSALMLTKDWAQQIFESLVWLVRLMIVVEVAEPGFESTSYGFLTTVCNLANLMLASAYNIASTTWDPESTDMAADTSQVRWHITYEFLFKYIVRFALAFIACWILPRQKRHLKEIKIRGAPNLIIPVVVFLVIALLFTAAITSALMSMFESTSCLKFAGGSGCTSETSE